MTFSQQIKSELCELKPQCKHCQKAMTYGMLFMSKTVTNDSITVNTESKEVAEFLMNSICEFAGVIVTVNMPDIRERAKRPIYSVNIENPDDVIKVLQTFFKKVPINKSRIDFSLFHSQCCQIAFLRGAYCIVGTTINPAKEYHFEFCVSTEKVFNQLYIIIAQISNNEIEIKQTLRGNLYVLYIKDSNQIEEILTYLGAVQCSMEIMNRKIEKDLRNTVNRRTNCETANIDKTINASVLQVQKIERIINIMGIDYLTPELKEVAELRIKNPDLSLNELCKKAKFEISRSGLNHRLKKICEIADKLK